VLNFSLQKSVASLPSFRKLPFVMEFLLRKMIFHKPRSLSRRILSAILFLSIYQLEESNSLVLSRNASGIVNDFQNVSDLSLINSTREGRRSG
jgi:hypothetical protein